MGSPTFGFPSGSNNATPPMYGSQTNPTGGSYGTSFGGSFPSTPTFGSPTTSFGGPTYNNPVFGMTGGSTSGMSGMSSGFNLGNNWSNLADMLGKVYGKGGGQSIYNILSQGLFNPQVASSFLNAMQPGIQRGEANILQSFGSEGSRFGSAAALGQGDYLSQVNLNEQQTLASMYMQAQQEQLGLLQGVLPSLQAERANQGDWMHSLLGGLEVGGSLLAAPFTGGMSLMGLSSGLSQLGQGIGSPASSTPTFGMPGSMGMGGMTNPWANTGTFGASAPSYNSNMMTPLNWGEPDFASISAAQSLGGSDPWSTGGGLPFMP